MANTQYVLRYLELLIAFASLYWWTQGGIEAAIMFATSSIAFVAQDFFWSVKAEERKQNREKDKETFDELLKLITSDDLDFLKNHGYGDSFSNPQIKGISRFVDTWNRVEREFIDPQLEQFRKDFYRTASDYVFTMGRYTFSDRYRTRRLSEELFYLDEEKWHEQEEDLDKLAGKAASSLETLIRAGRKKL